MSGVGRHRSSNAGAVTAAVIAGTVLLAGGGAWAVGSMLQDDTSGPSAQSTTSPSSTPSSTPSSEPSAEPSDTPTPESPSPTATAPDPAVALAAAHDACVAQVAAGERVAKASASSATHWRQHTRAQLDWEARKISLAQRTKVYADSKAFGDSDAKEFAAATKALAATGRACADAGGMDGATAGTKACQQRFGQLAAVHKAGIPVQSQWAEHMKMMAGKDHANMSSYHKRWLTMVAAAQPTLRTYDTAAAALRKAPACA